MVGQRMIWCMYGQILVTQYNLPAIFLFLEVSNLEHLGVNIVMLSPVQVKLDRKLLTFWDMMSPFNGNH